MSDMEYLKDVLGKIDNKLRLLDEKLEPLWEVLDKIDGKRKCLRCGEPVEGADSQFNLDGDHFLHVSCAIEDLRERHLFTGANINIPEIFCSVEDVSDTGYEISVMVNIPFKDRNGKYPWVFKHKHVCTEHCGGRAVSDRADYMRTLSMCLRAMADSLQVGFQYARSCEDSDGSVQREV